MAEFIINTPKISVPYYSLHEELKSHIINIFLQGDSSRLVYASNNYALRKRSKQINGNTNTSDDNFGTTNFDFPFISFKRTSIDFTSSPQRWTHINFSKGYYIDDLEATVRINPITIGFEGIVWTETEEQLVWFTRSLRFDADDLTELTVNYNITLTNPNTLQPVVIPMWSQLNWNNIDFEPEWQETDWLEKNRIHTIALDFEVTTFDINPLDPTGALTTEQADFTYQSLDQDDNIIDEEEYNI